MAITENQSCVCVCVWVRAGSYIDDFQNGLLTKAATCVCVCLHVYTRVWTYDSDICTSEHEATYAWLAKPQNKIKTIYVHLKNRSVSLASRCFHIYTETNKTKREMNQTKPNKILFDLQWAAGYEHMCVIFAIIHRQNFIGCYADNDYAMRAE